MASLCEKVIILFERDTLLITTEDTVDRQKSEQKCAYGLIVSGDEGRYRFVIVLLCQTYIVILNPLSIYYFIYIHHLIAIFNTTLDFVRHLQFDI